MTIVSCVYDFDVNGPMEHPLLSPVVWMDISWSSDLKIQNAKLKNNGMMESNNYKRPDIMPLSFPESSVGKEVHTIPFHREAPTGR